VSTLEKGVIELEKGVVAQGRVHVRKGRVCVRVVFFGLTLNHSERGVFA